MIRAGFIRHTLKFLRPAGTSRGVLHTKPCWFVLLRNAGGITGVGEVTHVPVLSPGDGKTVEEELKEAILEINLGKSEPCSVTHPHPGIRFAFETACRDLSTGGTRLLFESPFTSGEHGIRVNGLIWMGEREYMLDQIRQKVESGFRILKMKVGALDFSTELEVLRHIRGRYGDADLEIRLDANGAWTPEEAPEKLGQLSACGIHSIEQPLRQGQVTAMAELCRRTPIPVALDEELIGVGPDSVRRALLETIKPAYLILKPGLLGGWKAAESWIGHARETGTGWWVTSALESNIGLNAIAQWTALWETDMPQGLGTGGLYGNNIPSPLSMEGDALWYRPRRTWNTDLIEQAWKK